MQNLYLNIIKKLTSSKDLFTELGLDPIKTVDFYNGQPENPQQFEFVSPAVFIDYNIDWERGSSSFREGQINVDLHIITEHAAGSENWSDPQKAVKRLMYYELIDQLCNGVRSERISALNSRSEKPMQTEFFDYHVITFDARIVRQAAQKLIHVDGVKPIIKNE